MFKSKKIYLKEDKCEDDVDDDDYDDDNDNDKKNDNKNDNKIDNNDIKNDNEIDNNDNKNDKKNDNKNEKEKTMKIISTQDAIEGSWNENEETKIIKQKYYKEYELLMGLKDKNISEKVALTVIIILFVEKEHKELLGELILIIKKAKKFIKKETKMNYENLIKECNIK